MHRRISHGNPNPNRSMLPFHFLYSLARIHRSRARQSSSFPRAAIRCGRRINLAAYASMALAAGPSRAWSRVVLRSLQRRDGAQPTATMRAVTIDRNIGLSSRNPRENIGGKQEDELRRLVPGGREMDFCSLLEETGNYIQCLKAQVLLMQRIADSMSP